MQSHDSINNSGAIAANRRRLAQPLAAQHPAAEVEGEDTGFSITDILALLHKRTKLIVAVIAGLTAAAAVIVSMMPNKYTAISTVMLESREKTVTDVGRVVDGIRVDTPAIESQVEIIASAAIALRVIDKLGLRNDPEFGGFPSSSALGTKLIGAPSRRSTATTTASSAAATPAAAAQAAQAFHTWSAPAAGRRDYVLANFLDGLDVRRVRNSHVIEISYTSTSAAKAAVIANAIAQAYIAHELDQKIKQSEMATSFLKTKLKSLRHRVTVAEQAVQRFKADNNLYDSDGHLLSEKRLTRLMEKTIAARNDTAEARSRFEQLHKMMLEHMPKGAIADVLKSHTVRMLKEQHAKIAGRVAELAIKYGPRHPSMQKARAELRDIDRQINNEVDKILSNLKNEYDVAEAREATLRTNLATLERQQGKLGQIGVKLDELEREANSSRQLYEAILSRYKQTAETQSMQLPDSRIVETALVPLRTSAPKRKKTVVIAFASSIAIALGLALLLEFLQSGQPMGRATTREIRLQQLASLPSFNETGQFATSQFANDPLHAIRMVLADPQSEYTQAIEALVLALDEQFAPPGRQRNSGPPGARVMMLTSALPGDGRTTLASNLAHLYAMSGRRTLLIDGDLRKGGLTSLLAPRRHAYAGLHDCLAAAVPAQVAILHESTSGLNFLPARGHARQQLPVSVALASKQTAIIMAQLRKDFDMIVIDAPPLLPVADGRLLADHADQILFVMSWHKTPKELAIKAIRTLQYNADKLVGIIANQVASQSYAPPSRYWHEDQQMQPQPCRRAA